MQIFLRTLRKFFLLTAFVLTLTVATFGTKVEAASYNATDTWVIQWYLCGSDLERRFGSATKDLQELLSVNLPPNVKFVIETGGSTEWQNDTVANDAIERYLYDSEGLKRLEKLPNANMGDVDTLTDFIRYGEENFEADHRIFIFWDHGGGSIGGLCSDERYENSLKLNDLTEAFGAVYGSSPDNPPFEIIGFDACLMATYDTINAIDGFTRYVVASEESEPGCGWNYTGFGNALANNPAMNGAELGKIICNTYMEGCIAYDDFETSTLSVIDMTKFPAVRTAYENYGTEALFAAYEDPKRFFSRFGRSADKAENYSNDKKKYCSNMVDLADLAHGTKNLLPRTSETLIDAIENAVVYKVYGDYRDQGSGISGFYTYDGYTDDYLQINSAPLSQKLLYYYLVYGELPEQAEKFLESHSIDDVAGLDENNFSDITPPSESFKIFDVSSLEDLPVELDGNGNAFVTLDQEELDLISSVQFELFYVDEEEDVMLFLGSDADINADWETGVFKDNFRGVWPTLDGHLVYVEIIAENDGYNIYRIPIKLNGQECNLLVAYNFAEERYKIIGANRGLDSTGMSDRELIKLKAGDEITTLHYGMTISGDDTDAVQVEVETFTIGNNPTVTDENLPDGRYGYLFEFVSPTEDSALSRLVHFDIEGGEITTMIDVE